MRRQNKLPGNSGPAPGSPPQLTEIHDACLYQYRLAEQNGPDKFSRYSQQKEITELRAALPEFTTVSRRLQGKVIHHTATSWQRYSRDKDTGHRPKLRVTVGGALQWWAIVGITLGPGQRRNIGAAIKGPSQGNNQQILEGEQWQRETGITKL